MKKIPFYSNSVIYSLQFMIFEARSAYNLFDPYSIGLFILLCRWGKISLERLWLTNHRLSIRLCPYWFPALIQHSILSSINDTTSYNLVVIRSVNEMSLILERKQWVMAWSKILILFSRVKLGQPGWKPGILTTRLARGWKQNCSDSCLCWNRQRLKSRWSLLL